MLPLFNNNSQALLQTVLLSRDPSGIPGMEKHATSLCTAALQLEVLSYPSRESEGNSTFQ